jgi:3-dehydroquinate synthase
MTIALHHLTVETPSHHYPIVFGTGLIAQAGRHLAPYIKGHKFFIVSDDQVAAHYLQQLEVSFSEMNLERHTFIVPAGEASKSFSIFERIMNEMLRAEPDRHTTLIALGGGVVGDLTGFLAATLMRGVPFIQIPTSLLAQVDSSVGGKTAINCAAGKNMVGAFYQPHAVLIDVGSLHTLSKREILAGYAEVLKYALLGDAEFYTYLLDHAEAIIAKDADVLMHIIRHCCAMKAEIVAQDEKEQGRRALLNLGHTFGHAIEKHAAYDGTVLHGEAVAMGCLMAAQLAVHQGGISRVDYDQLHQHYTMIGLPTHLSRDFSHHHWDASQLTDYCYQDKKSERGGLTFITLNKIGDAQVTKNMDAAIISSIFQEFIA